MVPIKTIALLTAVIGGGILASDIYVPSLPIMTQVLHTTPQQVKWTMALYFFGVSVSQFFYGPLSERYGRKPTLYLGIIILLIGHITCLSAFSIAQLLIGRLLQGIGAAALIATARTIARDISDDQKTLAKVLSVLSLLVILVPAVAPALGAHLQLAFSWRASFVFLLFLYLDFTGASPLLFNRNLKAETIN